jgi:hypothetical protein
MASPHTAGSLALLWSAKPQLKHLIRISRCYIEQSAGPATDPVTQTCGGTTASDRPNNLFGWGMVNALAAINLGPDSDSDGIADACDCAAGDGSAFDAPPEVTGDSFSTSAMEYSWTPLDALAGPGTTYDVVRGLASDLRQDGGFASAVCLSDSQMDASHPDSSLPNPGEAFYYLVRGQNVCGNGSYGRDSEGVKRLIRSCM